MPSLPPVHRPDGRSPTQARQAQRQQADQRRGSARQRGYTTAWDGYAKRYLGTHALCIGCQAVGWVEPATCVDHIEPGSRAPEKFWDPNNHQPACGWHHDRVKQRMEHLLAKGEASVADMRLNSPLAMQMTLQMRP